jgi:hypothetical protein
MPPVPYLGPTCTTSVRHIVKSGSGHVRRQMAWSLNLSLHAVYVPARGCQSTARASKATDIDTAHSSLTGAHPAQDVGTWAEPASIRLPGGREEGHELA